MSKNSKKLLIILIAIVVALIGYFVGGRVVYTLGAKLFLANKYDWKITDIKTEEYHRDRIVSDLGFLGLDASNTITHYNKSWVFEYGGRRFDVERVNNYYADDYQLEDIFEWCTEYLQVNVDEHISGIEICSDIIYHKYSKTYSFYNHSSGNHYEYNYELPWNSQYVFSKGDSKKIINEIARNQRLIIFYYVDDLAKYGTLDSYSYIDENGEIRSGLSYEANEIYDALSNELEVLIRHNLINTGKYTLVLYSEENFERITEVLGGYGLKGVSKYGLIMSSINKTYISNGYY